jgi:hypothetical protein
MPINTRRGKLKKLLQFHGISRRKEEGMGQISELKTNRRRIPMRRLTPSSCRRNEGCRGLCMRWSELVRDESCSFRYLMNAGSVNASWQRQRCSSGRYLRYGLKSTGRQEGGGARVTGDSQNDRFHFLLNPTHFQHYCCSVDSIDLPRIIEREAGVWSKR